jgi:hypothetical protein
MAFRTPLSTKTAPCSHNFVTVGLCVIVIACVYWAWDVRALGIIVTVAMGIAIVLSPATCLCAPSPVHLSAITPLYPSNGPDAGQARCPLTDPGPPWSGDSRAQTSAATLPMTMPDLFSSVWCG